MTNDVFEAVIVSSSAVNPSDFLQGFWWCIGLYLCGVIVLAVIIAFRSASLVR